MGLYRMTPIKSHHLTILNAFSTGVFDILLIILIIGFQILKLFVWHMEFSQRKTLFFRLIF